MEEGLRHLSVKLNEAAEGGKAARDEFARFGLDGMALAKGGMGAAVDMIADRMRELAPPAAAPSLAMTLMGREGQALIPVFEKGSLAIHEMEAAGGKLGAIATQEDVDRATRAAEEMDHLGATLKGIQRDVAAGLAPVITAVASSFQDWLKGLDIKAKIKEGFSWLEKEIPVIIDGLTGMVKTFEHMGHKLEELADNGQHFAAALQHPGRFIWGEVDTAKSLAAARRAMADEAGDKAADSFAAGLKKGIMDALAAAKSPLDHPATGGGGIRGPSDELVKNIMETPSAALNIFDQYAAKLKDLQAAFAGATDNGMRFRNAVADLNENLAKSSATKLVEYLNAGASATDKLKAKYEEMVGVGLDKINPTAFATDLAKEFESLTGGMKLEEIHHAGVLEEGSKEAYSAVLHEQDRDNRPADMQQRMVAILEQLTKQQATAERTNQRIADAINRIFKKGV